MSPLYITLVYFLLLTWNSCLSLSVNSAGGQSVEYVSGQPAIFKRNDESVKLLWRYHPPGAKIFFIKCYLATTFSGSGKQQVLFWNTNSTQTNKNFKGRAAISNPENGELAVTLETPSDSDSGWYLCVFNTKQSVDRTGTLQLKRIIEPLQMATVTSSQRLSHLNITWSLYPPNSDIQSVLCYFKSISEFTWSQVYKFIVRSNKKESAGKFKRRIQHHMNATSFVLIITEFSQKDEGNIECAFQSEGSLKEIEKEIQIHFEHSSTATPGYQAATTCSPGPVKMDYNWVLVYALPVMTFLCGIFVTLPCFLLCNYCKNGKKKQKEPLERPIDQTTTNPVFQVSDWAAGQVILDEPGLCTHGATLPRNSIPHPIYDRLRGDSVSLSLTPSWQNRRPSTKSRTSDASSINKINYRSESSFGVVNPGPDYIKVDGKGQMVELDLEEDGTLSMSTLIAQFNKATGLRSAKRAVSCSVNGHKLLPPRTGWSNEPYTVVFASETYDSLDRFKMKCLMTEDGKTKERSMGSAVNIRQGIDGMSCTSVADR